ncbi:MAG: hypothetical protein GEV08_14275 [Acidimicrobiia bacterium]|nr:hypothetical protein [Acidimicrobiia bacterium]
MNDHDVATLSTPSDAPPDGAEPVAPPDADPPRRRRSRRFERGLAIGFTVLAAFAMAAFTLAQLHPGLLINDSTPAGGDMGAHVWGPAYLRDHLLPNFRLTGWSPDWYAGFPAYQFYMVLPALAIVIANLALSYGAAFKLVSVAGVVAMPICAAVMGRLFRLPFPGPAVLAIATLPFLFDTSFTILGGNIASTLAGEFAFSISLSLCLLYFGALSRGLETGRYRALAAALFGMAVLCHPLPGIFFAVPVTLAVAVTHLAGTALAGVRAVRPPEVGRRSVGHVLRGAWSGVRTPLWWLATMSAVGGALTCFWVVPFLWRRPYLNDMGWERRPTDTSSMLENLFHMGADGQDLSGFDLLSTMSSLWLIVVIAAVVGAVLSFAYRERLGIVLTLAAIGMAVMFALVPQARLWNARLLPFFYLCLYLLAGVGVALLAQALRTVAARTVAASVVALGVVVAVALPLGVLPGASRQADGDWSWLGMESKASFVKSWARWNYEGYEEKDAYGEYYGVVSMMDAIGTDPQHGCGRTFWEYDNEKLNSYGTPMALMLLPHWTDGCIGSMEGLFFESSATTPYHFLTQSVLSAQPSRPQREIPYQNFDIDTGVRQLQEMGVRYYLAYSETAKAAANAKPELTRISESGPWVVYEVADSELVAGLDNQPVVLDDIHQYQKDWLPVAAALYNDPDSWEVLRAAGGPDEWQRVSSTQQQPPTTAVANVAVSDIRTDNDSISFSVDQVGQPVLVKASYFPNWKADGADGPYRVMPNLMVVVPTSQDVTLSYGQTPVDVLAWALTFLGMAGLALLVWRPPLAMNRFRRAKAADAGGDEEDLSWLAPLPSEGYGELGTNGRGPAGGGPSGAGPEPPESQPDPTVTGGPTADGDGAPAAGAVAGALLTDAPAGPSPAGPSPAVPDGADGPDGGDGPDGADGPDVVEGPGVADVPDADEGPPARGGRPDDEAVPLLLTPAGPPPTFTPEPSTTDQPPPEAAPGPEAAAPGPEAADEWAVPPASPETWAAPATSATDAPGGPAPPRGADEGSPLDGPRPAVEERGPTRGSAGDDGEAEASSPAGGEPPAEGATPQSWLDLFSPTPEDDAGSVAWTDRDEPDRERPARGPGSPPPTQ